MQIWGRLRVMRKHTVKENAETLVAATGEIGTGSEC